MSEYIKREDALDAVLFTLVGTGHQSNAICAIRDIPTADVVEVVRCKDCKWWRRMNGDKLRCHNHYGFIACKETDYCSCGERKKENEG